MPLPPESAAGGSPTSGWYRRLDSLLKDALERPPGERRAFLERASGGDERLLEEVWDLLEGGEREDTFLRAGGALASGLLTETTRLSPGAVDAGGSPGSAGPPAHRDRKIGPWILREELGRGGMGVVYLARRAGEDFEQEVALKLLAGFVATPETLARFRAERQILAQLEHPQIARLIDGGTTAEGSPYFALELVRGRQIDRYCDEHRLTVEHRLELFLQLCDAVGYAHRKLIVHRDLKPSNVLVTDEGTPKLLDFGIAKLLEPGTAGLTRRRDRPMTPEYASPEQIRGEPASTATDVYGLGLLLYELLTGSRAHRLESRDWDEIERKVCTEPATRPSVAVARLASSREEGAAAASSATMDPAAARSTSRRRLCRRLRGDLDTIVLAALQKEPERRYPTVDRLAEDLRRHLAGHPIAARKEGWGYRFGKFLKRHRLGVAAASLVLLSGAGGLAGTLLQAERATMEGRRAAEVSEFLVDLLEVSDPELAQGRDVTVAEVLDQAAVRIDSELVQQPRLRARLSSLIGRLYSQLGRYEAAQSQLLRALSLQEDLLGPSHGEVAETLDLMARVLVAQGRFPEAEERALRGLAIRRGPGRRNGPALASSLAATADVFVGQGRFAEARQHLREALEVQERELGRDHRKVATTLDQWAFVEYQDGQLEESRRLYGESLEIHRRLGSDRSLGAAGALKGLAGVNMALGRRAVETEGFLLEALEISRGLLGERHPEVADLLGSLGTFLSMTGRFDESEAAYLEALDILHERVGPEHPSVANLLNNLGSLRFRQERYGEAAEVYGRSLEQRRHLLGAEHPSVATTWSYLAYAWHRVGDPRAEAAYRDSLELLLRSRGEDHAHTANVHNDLGRLLLDSGRCEEGEAHLQRAFTIRRRIFGEDGLRAVTSGMNLAGCLGARGEFAEAHRLLDAARRRRVEVRGEDDLEVAEVDLFRAELLARQGEEAEAAALFAATASRIRSVESEDHWLSRLARILRARNPGF